MEIYHVINHGIENRKLFLDSRDYARFVHNLYEFNDTAPAQAFDRRGARGTHDVGPPRSYIMREKLVEIHGWCLMKDHYHLLISECAEGGISKFIMKINVGYAKYYNERYERRGHVFQGKTKKILIKQESHFLYILHYIHLNSLDYLTGATKWRERDKGTIKNTNEALEYMDTYRWSSYLDYCNNKNFPSILSKKLFGDVFQNYREEIREYLSDLEIQPIVPADSSLEY